MIAALREGLRRALRQRTAAALLLAVNLGCALVLAAPMGATLLAAVGHGGTSDLRPENPGALFALRNFDLLLRGELPVHLFSLAPPAAGRFGPLPVGTLPLALGAAYLVLQAVLAGGVLAVLRGQTRGTVRGLLHGAGFHAGRMLRLLALGLVVDGVVFALAAGLTALALDQAREEASELAVMAWMLGRSLVVLLAVLAAHTVSSFARVITVVEERTSVLLAWLSALALCARAPLRTLGLTVSVALAGLTALALWALVDARLPAAGSAALLVSFVLMQALMLGRIGLRLWLLGAQVAFHVTSTPRPRARW